MPRGKRGVDLVTLQMALVGYQIERQKIDDKISEIRAQLKDTGGASSSLPAAKKDTGTRRVLSPAARRRIAAAQKKRWAEHRKRLAQNAKQS